MKKVFLLIAATIISGTVFTQQIDFNNYQALRCRGEIPDDFQTLTADRYDLSLRTETAHNHNKPLPDDEAEFLLQTDYSINAMLLSGKVLFGDTITNYINRVASRVLVNDPDLRAKLRFYCLRSSEANAFSTRQGIVFVTMGLMAQLENEAQLAFILSHEIAHYEKRHTLVSYEQRQEVFDKDRADRYNSYDEQIRTASNYNKEIESQADSLGLLRLAKSGYDCQESIGSLFMLQFSEMPFEDYPFKTDFMEAPDMKFPRALFLDSLRPIDFKTDMENDDYSTHPNIATRRKRLQLILDQLQGCGKEKFKEGEKTFLLLRKVARFEVVRILLNSRQYAETIYNAQVLQFEDPTSAYLKLTIGKALYGMAKYKNHDRYAETAGYFGKKEGNQQQCYHFFSVLKPAQLNLIALRYLFNLSLSDTSKFVIGMRDDLAEEAVEINEITVDQMKKALDDYTASQKDKKTGSDSILVANKKQGTNNQQQADPNAFVSKYDKLRNEKQLQDQNELASSKFHLLAFADVLDAPEFIKMFDKAVKSVPVKKEKIETDDADVEKGLVQFKVISSFSASRPDTSAGIGTDKVVFIEPFYLITDVKKGFTPIESERSLLSLDSTIRVKAVAGNINHDFLFPKDFASGDVEKYNDFSVVNEWLDEKTDHGDLFIIPSETDRTTRLAQKYHTGYFCYNGITDYEKETNYYMFVYDVTSGTPEYYKKVSYKYAPDKTFISTCLLYTVNKIKTK